MGPVDIVSWVLIVVGAAAVLVGALGLLRLPDVFSRMHAAGVVDTFGAAAILLGLAAQAGLTLVTAKLIMILAFLWLTGPTATHALARAALGAGAEPVTGPDEPTPPSASEGAPDPTDADADDDDEPEARS